MIFSFSFAQDDPLDLDDLLNSVPGGQPTPPAPGGGDNLDDILDGMDAAPGGPANPGGGDDLGDLFGSPDPAPPPSPGGTDDFGDLFGSPEPAPGGAAIDPVPVPPPPGPDPIPAPSPVPTPPPAAPGGGDLGDLFGIPEPAPAPAPGGGGGDLGDLFGSPDAGTPPAPPPGDGGGIDDLFGAPAPGTPDPIPSAPGGDDLFGGDPFGTGEPAPMPEPNVPGGIDDLFGPGADIPEPVDPGPGFQPPEPVFPADPPPEAPGGGEVTPGQEQEDPGISKVEKERIIAIREKLLLQERQRQAMNSYQDAVRLYSAGRWSDAMQRYNQVLEEIPDVAVNEQWRDLSRHGVADCYFKMAKAIFDDRETVINIGGQVDDFLDSALTLVPDHEASLQLKGETILWMDKVAREDLLDKKVLSARRGNVRDLIRKGQELFNQGDYDNAEVLFENVLSHDKYNQDALTFLNKIAEKRYAFHSLERDLWYRRAMDEVRNRWVPRTGPGPQRTLETEAPTEEDDEEDPSEMLDLMEQILIPELSFRDASLYDVVDFLIAASREGDPRRVRAEADGEGADGVNIIIDLKDAAPAPSAAPAGGGGGGDTFFDAIGGDDGGGDAFGFGDAGGGDFGDGGGLELGGGGNDTAPRVTINLRRVNLKDALDFVTDVTNLKYVIKRGTVVIRNSNAIDTPITRFYPVDPNVFASNVAGPAPGGGDPFGGGGGDPFADPFGDPGGGAPAAPTPGIGGQIVTTVFQGYGVGFPPGTSAIYQPNLGQIVVVNSAENHKEFKAILDKINKPPVQVEIEARFVEVQQNELEEFGLEWRLTDDYEIAYDGDAIGPLGSRPRLQIDQNNNGLSQALRFFNFEGTSGTFEPSTVATAAEGAIPVGGILSVSSVLTNPELQTILHLINQRGSMDLLSAPRITTLSGINAQIEVVREIIYPTEFEIEQSQFGFGGGAGGVGGGIGAVTPPTVTPGAFETRETGVILNVTPTVSPDRYTIQLALIPEIAELVEWIQYGSSVGLQDGSEFTFNIPQPIFASRNVTTSMVVWDGHSVVMGGLIREDLVTFDDKIPILGDIPLLGRAFRSQGERSTKRNLLIFVSARLVDPGGRPINRVKDDLRYRRINDSFIDTTE